MKRLLLLTCLFSITSASFAQINKGQWLVGGNISYSTSKNDVTNTKHRITNFQISPNAGYFIIDKLAVGARVNLSRVKNEVEQNVYTESTNNGISLSPFVRYYFLPKAQKINLFADAGYAYGRSKYTTELIGRVPQSGTSTLKGDFHSYYISAGPALFLTPKTAIELTLNYNYSKQKDYEYSNKGFMAGIGVQIHLGK